VRATRAAGAQFIIVAAPVASHEAMQLLRPEADRLVMLTVPTALVAIGAWYEDFDQVPDSEVQQLLQRSRDELKSPCLPPRTAP
jgi:putative phosphoribosyl transferase